MVNLTAAQLALITWQFLTLFKSIGLSIERPHLTMMLKLKINFSEMRLFQLEIHEIQAHFTLKFMH